MQDVLDFLRAQSRDELLPWAVQQAAAAHYSLPFQAIEEIALENGLLPSRYQRNRKTLTTANQLQLLRSSVAVIGCGGLGGYIIEQLARLGIGRIIAIDPDLFEEQDLNRQLFALPSLLGTPKVEAAAQRVATINPAVIFTAVQTTCNSANAPTLLAMAQVVADAVDNIPTRLELARACHTLGIPLVHGAIDGWYGQITTQFPGDRNIEMLYPHAGQGGGGEGGLGNPAFTPAIVASLQVAEICKLLLQQGTCLRHRVAFIDLLAMETEFLPLPRD